jgi:hypothetical protein
MPRPSYPLYLTVLTIFSEEYIQGDSKLLLGFPWSVLSSSLLFSPASCWFLSLRFRYSPQHSVYFELEVLTAVLMKSCIWWCTLCSPMKINRRFGTACRLRLQGRRVKQDTNMEQAARFRAWLTFQSWRWKILYPRSTTELLPKYTTLQCRTVHTVIAQKIKLFAIILFPHISHPYKTQGKIIQQH